MTQLEGQKRDLEFSRRINNAVERASSDYHSGTSSDEESSNTSMSTSMSSSISSSTTSSNLSVPEPKCIPTVSNPNSVYQVWPKTFFSLALSSRHLNSLGLASFFLISFTYLLSFCFQFSEFGTTQPPQNWGSYPKRKPYANEGYQQHSSGGQYPPHKSFKGYRPSYAFSGPRMDRYHWVSKNRS